MKIWIHPGDTTEGPYDEGQIRMLGLRPDTPVWYPGLSRWVKAKDAPLTAPYVTEVEAADPFAGAVAPPEEAFEVVEVVEAEETAVEADTADEALAEETVAEAVAEATTDEGEATVFETVEEQTSAGSVPPAIPDVATPPPAPQAPVPPAIPVAEETTPPPLPTPERPGTYIWLSVILTVLFASPIALLAVFLGMRSRHCYKEGDYAGARTSSEWTQWLIMIAIVLGLMCVPLAVAFMLR